MEIVKKEKKGVMWADLGTLKIWRAEQFITPSCIKENLRRASKESITVIKHGKNKRGSESFGGFKRKIPSD